MNGFEFKLLEPPNLRFRPVKFDNDILVVESKLDDWEDALYENFTEIYEEIEIKEINQAVDWLSVVDKQFANCTHKLVFLEGEEI